MNTCQLGTTAEKYLTTAEQIGCRICREAIWFKKTAATGWDPSHERVSADGLRPDTTVQSLGPDLYAGTSGVALFLGELHSPHTESDLS